MRLSCWSSVTARTLATFLCLGSIVHGDDFFLTIGGGYAPSSNQASLERNVLYFDRVLASRVGPPGGRVVLFADGDDSGLDLQVIDENSVPKANRLMAEFFGSTRDLGLHYRNHEIAARGPTSPGLVRECLSEIGEQMKPGDRLVLYVTSHGGRSRDDSNPHDTSILLWDNKRLTVKELVGWLGGLPEGTELVTIMVQCHAGGFARYIFDGADPDKGLAPQLRCGFFATLHDRAAAGCTPQVDEANYAEYSTYFWEALSGVSRLGEEVERPDYDGDGIVSFEEAHAYTVLHSQTIDLPIKTSGEFLRTYSRQGKGSQSELLDESADLDSLLALAGAADRAVLVGLAEELSLDSADPISETREQLSRLKRDRRRGGSSRFRGRSSQDPASRLRREIADDLRGRWPELANVLNPGSIELLTDRSDDFIRAIETHPDYPRYRNEVQKRESDSSDSRIKTVRYERFLRTAENVILAENLRRLGDAVRIAQYESILAAERGTLSGRL